MGAYVPGVAYKQLFPYSTSIANLCVHTILFGGSVPRSQKNIIIVNTDITADPRITNIPPQIN